jgi:predicted Zn-dependent protease
VSHRDAWLAEARGLFRAAIEDDPERPEPHLGLGETHLAPGQSVADAREPLERALALLPIHPATRIALARVYADADRDEEAMALLAPIVATQAETPAGAEALALIEEHGFRDHEEKNDAN